MTVTAVYPCEPMRGEFIHLETMIKLFIHGGAVYPWDTLIDQFIQGKPWQSSLSMGNNDRAAYPWETMIKQFIHGKPFKEKVVHRKPKWDSMTAVYQWEQGQSSLYI